MENINEEKLVLKEIRHLVTLQCPLSCEHCYCSAGAKHPKARQYSQTEIDRFYHHFKPEVVSATGGEPLIEYETVKQIARSINAYGGELELVTSAFMLTPEMANELKATNPNISYQISIDGLEEHHNKVRGNNQAFDRAINAMKFLLASGNIVKARLTLTQENYEETVKVIELLESFNSDNIRLIIRPVVNFGRARENNIKSVEDNCAALLAKYSATSKKMKISITERCGYCTNSAAIDDKGDIYECCYLIPNPEYYIGNISDDLEQLTRNPEFMNHKGKCYIKDKRNL
jgi:MoaA/NifB/PqqE/SkfB family radical SAM enzyme